ncbi:MAG TPA: tetraacyldisaccharide 4'-kinase [Gemmatimonadaceae bacterium]|nr:tetraacyldisaccharide 4'-kinase [Gemmatimonadaceae bacterium]
MRNLARRFVWESTVPAAGAVRLLLAPLRVAFAAGVALRNAAYDNAWVQSHALALPALSVGNLTVGGTGKTPISAWIASRLAERGARPAIVLRGVGDDEALVHRHLNPGIPVLSASDRVLGVLRAREAGATVVVLDDGFQHRRARRDADIVLLSADRFGPVRLLPTGPWREPLSSLARAHAVVVTRKAATYAFAAKVLERVMRFAPRAFGAVVELAPDVLVNVASGHRRPVGVIGGKAVLAISGIGDPGAFESQLRTLGAVVSTASLADHHAYSASEARSLAALVTDEVWAVCTLKDAVKLTQLWPREAPPLWYLSQRVKVESGADDLSDLVASFAVR